MTALRGGCLFAGAGALELAVGSVLDVDPVWFVENDPAASRVLAHHWPGIPNYGDITTVDWASVEPIDVLTGGFPCQDVSAAGKRTGLRPGTRSGLWAHMVYAIDQLRPRLVIAENVRGLLSGGEWIDEPVDRCICGWVDRRRRLHLHSREEELLFQQSGSRDDRTSVADITTVAPTLGGLAGSEQGSDGAMGVGVLLGSPGAHSSRFPPGNIPTPDHENGAGSVSYPLGGHQGIVTQTTQWVVGVDRSRALALLEDSPADYGIECEGSIPAGRPEIEEIPSNCPACGRDLGDRSSRHVFRSWVGAILGSLADVGYDARWCGIRASDVGAPHGRFRVFILAWPAADSDCVGPVRGGGPRGRWPGSPDCGEPVPDTNNAGRGPGSGVGGPAGQAVVGSGGDGWGTAVLERETGPAIGLLSWGEYELAIRRWERIIGRLATAPTVTGQRGGQQLSPMFTEWMMGWPDGWVTSVPGISRSDQIKLCGNGVVPQQAAWALRYLMTAVAGM